MTKPGTKNVGASVRQRLLNKARETGRPFSELLQYFAMERFLYRLSKSQFADKFVLKGALMLTAWNAPLLRPTMDIDLLGTTGNDIGAMAAIAGLCGPLHPMDSVSSFRLDGDPLLKGFRQTHAKPWIADLARANGATGIVEPDYRHGPTELTYAVLLFPNTAAAQAFNQRMTVSSAYWLKARAVSSQGSLAPRVTRRNLNPRQRLLNQRYYRSVLKSRHLPVDQKLLNWLTQPRILDLQTTVLVNRMLLNVHLSQNEEWVIKQKARAGDILTDGQSLHAVRSITQELVRRASAFPGNRG